MPQVRVLEESGQLPLAYVAAATHGLSEDADRIAQQLSELPELPSGAMLLQPPTPILKEDNWPLLTVTKGFFELLAAKGRAEAAAAKGGAAGAADVGAGLEDGALEGAGWGGDDLDLDLGGGAAGAKGDGEEGEAGEGGEEGGWDMEDLELSPEVLAEAAAAAGAGAAGAAGPFVAPAPGLSASQRWLEKRSQLAVEHVAAGSFQSAMSLLFRQLGATAFEPLRTYFLDVYAASHATLPGLQGVPAVLTHLDR